MPQKIAIVSSRITNSTVPQGKALIGTSGLGATLGGVMGGAGGGEKLQPFSQAKHVGKTKSYVHVPGTLVTVHASSSGAF